MTAEEIRSSGKAFLSPNDVKDVLHVMPYSLNVTIKCGGTLPFPHIMIGTRLKFPREAFIEWAEKTKLM